MRSKRTEATDISIETKIIVKRRDKGKCIICGQTGIPNAHYIRRSQRWIRNRTKRCMFMCKMPRRF